MKTTRDAPLRDLEDTLKSKLSAWFSVGSLELEQLTWDSPASLLEKVMQFEAVHAIPDWAAMKQRVAGPGRMCFAYLHRGMPLVPLTFIQVTYLADCMHLIRPVTRTIDCID